MKTLLVATTLVALAALSACSGSDDQVATDSAGAGPSSPFIKTTPAETTPAAGTLPGLASTTPAAPGRVSSQGPVTVVDTGDGPQVCLGPTSKIYPPRCTGPALVDWTWDDTATTDMGTTFGSWALSGTWDGTSLTVTDAVPASLYDAPAGPAGPEASPLPTPATTYDEGELTTTAETLSAALPSTASAVADGAGHVLVDVTYDDGSLQAWADQRYGAGVVVVRSRLADAG